MRNGCYIDRVRGVPEHQRTLSNDRRASFGVCVFVCFTVFLGCSETGGQHNEKRSTVVLDLNGFGDHLR